LQVLNFSNFKSDQGVSSSVNLQLNAYFCNNPILTQSISFSEKEILIKTDTIDYFINLSVLACFYDINFDFCITDPPPVPPNDDFANAINLPVSPNLKPIVKIAGTTKYATYETKRMSIQACSGTDERDVWYKFKATQSTHLLRVGKLKATGSAPIKFIAYVYKDSLNGVAACYQTDLQDSTLLIKDLEAGKNYYLVIAYANFNFTNLKEGYSFEISMATPPTPANDLRTKPITLKEGKDWDCSQKIAGATRWATHDYNPAIADVWYRFQATSKVYQIKLENIVYVNQNPTATPKLEAIDSLTGKSIKGNGNIMLNCDIGKVYYVLISTEGIFNQVYFDICLTEPIETAQNRFCENAPQIPVNQGFSAEKSINGVTPIKVQNFDYEEEDYQINTLSRNAAWFKFTATQTRHTVQIFDVEYLSNLTNISYRIYESKSNDCHNFYYVSGHANNSNTFSTEVGKTYYVLVKGQNRFRFRIAILTPPLMPNDECSKAINVSVSPNTAVGITYVMNFQHEAAGKEFWYSFVALSQMHYFKLITSNKMPPCTIYEGDDCGNKTLIYQIKGLWYNGTKLPNLVVGKKYYLQFERESDFDLDYYPFAIITPGKAPAYDYCKNALEIKPSNDIQCSYTALTFKNTTRSSRRDEIRYTDCDNYITEDIWLKFTATSTRHLINFENAVAFVSVYESCDSSKAIQCITNNEINGLTIGKTYLLRLGNSNNNDDLNIKICLTTIPPAQINDEIEQAITLPINPSLTCSLTQKGDLAFATISNVSTTCLGRAELWYKFKPTTNRIRIRIQHNNIKETNLLYYSVLQVIDFNNKKFKTIACQRDSSSNELDFVGLAPNEEYYMQVYTNWEIAASLQFTLCVSQPPIPPVPSNDLCVNAILLTSNNTPLACADNFQYTVKGSSKQDDGIITNCNQEFDVWFKFVAESTTYQIFRKFDRSEDPGGTITLYDGQCDSLNYIHCTYIVNDFSNFDNLEIGKTYYLKVGFPHENEFGFCISKTPKTAPNDNCNGAKSLIVNKIMLPTVFEVVNNTNATLSTTGATTSCNWSNAYPDLWYKFVATQSTHWVRAFDKTNVFSTVYIELYENPCDSFPILKGCKENLGRFGELVAGRTYYIRIATNDTGNFYYKFAVLTDDNLDRYSCEKALEIPVPFAPNFQKVAIQTTFINKTDSSYNPCTGSQGKNVMRTWIKFKANHHRILAYFNHAKVNDDHIIYGFYSGNCNNLKFIECKYAYNIIFENLKKDSTYYMFFETPEKDFALFDIILQADTITRNDDCVRAKAMSVNNNMIPTTKYNTTFKFDNPISYAFQSFKFTATSTNHILSFSNLKIKKYKPIEQLIVFGMVEKCAELYTSDYHFIGDSMLLMTNLVPGKEYIMSIYDEIGVEFNTDLALLTPPSGSVNINCQTAELITASKSNICTNKTKAIFNFVGNKDKRSDCLYANQKLTYKFVAQARNHVFSGKPKWAAGYHEDNIYFAYTEINDSCVMQSPICKTIFGNPFLNQDYEAVLNNLTVGKTYLLEIAITDNANASEIDFCIKGLTSDIVNDNCEDAILLTPSATATPTQIIKGNLFATTVEPKFQLLAVGDIWYKFVATNKTHALLLNGCNENLYLNFQESDCNGNSISYCSGTTSVLFNDLTVGKEYLIQVWQNYKQNCEFEIALITPPITLANDEYSNAKSLIVNDNEQPTQTQNGTTIWATQYRPLGDCNYFNGDVWYNFIAKAKSHRIMLLPTAAQSNLQQLYVTFEQDTVANSPNNYIFIRATDTTSIYGQVNNLKIGRKYYFKVQNTEIGVGSNLGSNFIVAVTTPTLPKNYTCENAEILPVNNASATTQFYHHNNKNNFPQPNIFNEDRCKTWFKFTPKNDLHYLSVRNWEGNKQVPLYFSYTIYEKCNDLSTELYTLDYPSIGDSILPKLTIGKEYYVQVTQKFLHDTYILYNNLNVAYDIAILTNPPRPSNDDEQNAAQLTVNQTPKCNTKSSGSMLYATSSNAQSYNDLWYKFKATSNYHTVNLSNIKALIGDVVDIRFECYAQQVSPIDNYNSIVYFCEIGVEYKIKVYSNYKGSFSRCSFDICVTSLVPEDNFQGAIAAFANAFAAQSASFKGAACNITAVGNSEGATYSSEVGVPTGTCGQGILPRDIWFKHIVEGTKNNILFTFVKKPQGADAQAIAYHIVNGKLQVINTTNCPVDTLRNLTKGDTIYFRIWDASDTHFGNYEVCIQSLKKTIATKNIICGTVSLRPIPVQDLLTANIEFVSNSNYKILIYNILGAVVMQQDLVKQTDEVQIDVSVLSTGSYIFSISDGEHLYSRKFVKL
jgi:hypothetical protein